MRMLNLYIATPMYGGECKGNFQNSLYELRSALDGQGIEHRHARIGNDSISRARNNFVDDFLRSPATHLLFWDADIGIEAEHVMRMLLEGCDLDMIGGVYPKKTINWKAIKQAVELGYDVEDLEHFAGDLVFTLLNRDTVNIDKPFEIAEVGCGLMLIRRETFEALQVPTYVPDSQLPFRSGKEPVKMFFRDGIWPAEDRYLTEDYWFCRAVRAAGMAVWLAPWAECTHMGGHIFRGSVFARALIDGKVRKTHAVAA